MAEEEDARREVQKMLPHLHGKTVHSEDVLVHYARSVSMAALVSIRETVQRKNVGVGYAVNAMKNEAKRRRERSYD